MADQELPDLKSDKELRDRYAEILRPLFDARRYNDVHALFELACCLVRTDGMQDRDWDPIEESESLVSDLSELASQELDLKAFPHPARTRARLGLVAYSHLTEADYFYHLLANLLRIRNGSKYAIDPFRDLWRKFGKDQVPPSVNAKIKRIATLGEQSGVDVAALLSEFHFSSIRNAAFHADYTLTDTQFRMRHGWHVTERIKTPVIGIDELRWIIRQSIIFYSLIMSLHRWARRQFFGLHNTILPYDSHYKALLEFLFEGDDLCGFRTYWPNRSVSEFIRTTERGCRGQNIVFAKDDSIDFMVGIYAQKPGSFSPLVEEGAEPAYAARPHGGIAALHWPTDLKPYQLS